MSVLRLFLASSEELIEDRVKFGDFISDLNNRFFHADILFKLEKWEYLSADWIPDNKQNQYNQVVAQSDFCIVLFWTKIGPFTEQELNTAYEARMVSETKRLLVYFKDLDKPSSIDPIQLNQLNTFRKNSYQKYGNWVASVKNNEHFQLCVLREIIVYLNESKPVSELIRVADGKLYVGDRVFFDLEKAPFVGNNKEYTLLCHNIEILRALMAELKPEDVRYSKYAQELLGMIEQRESMVQNLWQTALTITKLKADHRSDRLDRAINLFEKGDNNGALAILKEEEIDKDVKYHKGIIKTGSSLIKKGRQGLNTNLDEYLLKIQLLINRMSDGWVASVKSLFEKCFEIGQDNLEKGKYVELLLRYRDFSDLIGNYKEALEYGMRALEIQLSSFNDNHPDLANSYNYVGTIFCKLSNYKESLDFLQRGLEIYRSFFGNNHPTVASSYNNIGIVYGKLGYRKKSYEYVKKALDIRISMLSEDHPDLANSLINVGYTLSELGNQAEAMKYLQKGLEVHRTIFGDNHPDVASSYNNIGSCYSKTGDHKTALDYLLKGLMISRSIFGDNHPDVAQSYSNVGYAYMELGDYNRALEYSQTALRIRIAIHGKSHPEVADSYINIGCIYGELGDYKKAIDNLLIALEIKKTFFGENHPAVATCCFNIGHFYELSGDTKNANKFIQRGRAINKRLPKK